MLLFQEELLEPVARFLRFREIVNHLEKDRSIDILDVGSGPNTPFHKFLNNEGFNIGSYTALDPLSKGLKKNIKYIKRPVAKKIPSRSNSQDYVVAAAFIEHIENPKEILEDMVRIIKPGGKVIITTPTPRAKVILEFLSDKLSLISRREIQEHKNYFDKKSLTKLLPKNKKNLKTYHKYFEFGLKLNNLFVIEKLK